MPPGWSGRSGRGKVSSKPTRQAMPEHDAVEGSAENAEQALTPGAVLDHGRYRLLAKVGSDPRCDAELWRAKDGVLGRDVALTILTGDRSDSQSACAPLLVQPAPTTPVAATVLNRRPVLNSCLRH